MRVKLQAVILHGMHSRFSFLLFFYGSILCFYFIQLISRIESIKDNHNSDSSFPSSIPHFKVRRYNDKIVTRGSIQNLWSKKRKYSFKDFSDILQCSPNEPELFEGKGGALALAKYIPLTNVTIELFCASLESQCELATLECFNEVEYFKKKTQFSNIPPKPLNNQFRVVRLLRVINGILYYDWPWGVQRSFFRPKLEKPAGVNIGLIDEVVSFISDLPDSVFFVGGEGFNRETINLPIPLFSFSPSFVESGDLPAPWKTAFTYARKKYEEDLFIPLVDENIPLNLTSAIEIDQYLQLSWNSRIDKAAFYGAFNNRPCNFARRLIFEFANFYPELIEARWYDSIGHFKGL